MVPGSGLTALVVAFYLPRFTTTPSVSIHIIPPPGARPLIVYGLKINDNINGCTQIAIDATTGDGSDAVGTYLCNIVVIGEELHQKRQKPDELVEPIRTWTTLVAQESDGSNVDLTISNEPASLGDSARTQTVVVGGDNSNVTVGNNGVAIGGFQSTAQAGTNGLAYVLGGSAKADQPSGIAITREGGTAHAANYIAASYRGGSAIMDGAGVAISINEPRRHLNDPEPLGATAQASLGGLIVLGYFSYDDENAPSSQFVAKIVDDASVKSNTPYKLKKTGNVYDIVQVDGSDLKP